MKNKFKRILSTLLSMYFTISIGSGALLKGSYGFEIAENEEQYEEQIDENNDYIQEYANYIKSLNLGELEVIMKVMYDTWNEINGYGKCEDLVLGYYRLAFQEEGMGVCTSFADDFTAKINAINPDYNAKNIIVYMDTNDETEIKTVNIKRNIIESDNVEEVDNINLKQKLFGNHMVSVMEIKNKNLYLVVDVTNLLIGILEDGKITILNTNENLSMDYRVKSTNVSSTENLIEFYIEYLDTFSEPNITLEEMLNEYGYEAQVKALDNVDNIEPFSKRLVKSKR